MVAHFSSVLLMMRNISDNFGRENQNPYFTLKDFYPKLVPFIEIMRRKMLEPDRLQIKN